MELRVPVTRISEIVNDRRAISADTALRLERYFGMSADFWLGVTEGFRPACCAASRGKENRRGRATPFTKSCMTALRYTSTRKWLRGGHPSGIFAR